MGLVSTWHVVDLWPRLTPFRWPWGLAEGAARAGWKPGDSEEEAAKDPKILDAVYALSGPEAEKGEVSGDVNVLCEADSLTSMNGG